MKKILLLAFILTSSMLSFGQSEGPELGVRFGGGFTGFSAVDFVYPVSDVNRLQFDLGFGNNFLSIDGLYEWQFDIGENFVVYPGFGAGFYSSSYRVYDNRKFRDETYRSSSVVLLGVIGIEYQIQPVPLTVGLDFRPSFGFNSYYGYGSVGALMVRYRF